MEKKNSISRYLLFNREELSQGFSLESYSVELENDVSDENYDKSLGENNLKNVLYLSIEKETDLTIKYSLFFSESQN
jgi:hypothetical protein